MSTEQPEEIVQVGSMSPHEAEADSGTPHVEVDGDWEAEQPQQKKEGKKEGPRDREPGKSILPFLRVQKIIKADKDLPMVARDATFLISLATEEFIKRFSQACQKLAEREKRTTVQQKDVGDTPVASIVRRVDEFLFLEEIIGSQEPTGKRRPHNLKAKADNGASGDRDESQPTLRNFMQTTGANDKAGEAGSIRVNEDGVMYTDGPE